MAALIIAPTSKWWLLLLSVLPVHIAVELASGVPLPMLLCWFVSNCFEALLGASLVRAFIPRPVRLNTARSVGIFAAGAGVLAALLSSFLDAGFVSLNRWGDSSYLTVWQTRFLSNMLATLTIVPIVLVPYRELIANFRKTTTRCRLELLTLGVGLVLTCWVAFGLPAARWQFGPGLIYAPIPLLLWAAVRFGPVGISLALGVVTSICIGGAVSGGGPFTSLEPDQNALSLQLFLFVTGVPLSLLAATTRERSRAERKVAESQGLLALTLKSAHVGVWETDLETGRFTADDVVRDMMGDPESHAEGYRELVSESPFARSESGPPPARAPTTLDLIPDREFLHEYPTGTMRCLFARGMLLRGQDGRPLRAMGIAIDISERKRVEQAVRDYDMRLSLAATAAGVGFWSVELATGDVWVSDDCAAMIGIAPGEDPSAALNQLVPQLSVGASEAQLDGTFGSVETIVGECRIALPDGTGRWVRSSAQLERNTMGRPIRIIGVTWDITAQRDAEWQAGEERHALSHLSRVATVGELTAAIVHEVGQPLGAIRLNAQTAVRLAGAEEIDVEELRAVAEDLLRDSRRAGSIIAPLRDLLRRNESSRTPLDLRGVVQDALELARSELAKQHIELVLGLPDDEVMVWANRAQLQQVLLNVTLNARDAINASDPDRRQIVVTVSKTSEMASVRIADSGGGIAQEHLRQVFEPYFTSKPDGLGLGLAVSRSIMIDHGGDLRAENVEGGAVLQLILPEPGSRPRSRAAVSAQHDVRHSPYSQQPPPSQHQQHL